MRTTPPPIHPSALRNRGPLLEVLQPRLAAARTVLEVAAGSGAHAVHFAEALPHLEWLPTDSDPASLEALEARRRHHALPNLRPGRLLDAADSAWPVTTVDAIYCGNMIHISPWAVTLGLLAGAGRVLSPEGQLFTYGPYRIGGEHTAESNASFDRSLRDRDPAWGVRDLEALVEAASAEGLQLRERIAMPANNFTLVFRRAEGSAED